MGVDTVEMRGHLHEVLATMLTADKGAEYTGDLPDKLSIRKSYTHASVHTLLLYPQLLTEDDIRYIVLEIPSVELKEQEETRGFTLQGSAQAKRFGVYRASQSSPAMEIWGNSYPLEGWYDILEIHDPEIGAEFLSRWLERRASKA